MLPNPVFKVLVTQLCLTLCNPMECSPQGSSVHGISQARMLEWVAISSSRGSSQPRARTRSPTLKADSLLSEPPGKPSQNQGSHSKHSTASHVGRLTSQIDTGHRLVQGHRGTIHARCQPFRLHGGKGDPAEGNGVLKGPDQRVFTTSS